MVGPATDIVRGDTAITAGGRAPTPSTGGTTSDGTMEVYAFVLDTLDEMAFLSLSESNVSTIVLYVSNQYDNFVNGLLLSMCDSFLEILNVC